MSDNTDNNIFISKNVNVEGLKVGKFSMVGDDKEQPRNLNLGKNINIGRFCFIEGGVSIGDNFVLDDYCAVYSGAKIGSNVKLLYGKKIYGNAHIGNDCIIGGNIPERCILGDRVTFMGEVAHSHYNPTLDWDTTDELSPIIGDGSIIGVNALIVGGITIGKNCYVSAGEIIRTNLEDNMVFLKGKVIPISKFKGLIKTRF